MVRLDLGLGDLRLGSSEPLFNRSREQQDERCRENKYNTEGRENTATLRRDQRAGAAPDTPAEIHGRHEDETPRR